MAGAARRSVRSSAVFPFRKRRFPFIPHVYTSQHSSTLLNTSQHSSILLKTSQHSSTLLNTSQHFSTLLNTSQHFSTLLNTPQHSSALISTSQHSSSSARCATLLMFKFCEFCIWSFRTHFSALLTSSFGRCATLLKSCFVRFEYGPPAHTSQHSSALLSTPQDSSTSINTPQHSSSARGATLLKFNFVRLEFGPFDAINLVKLRDASACVQVPPLGRKSCEQLSLRLSK